MHEIDDGITPEQMAILRAEMEEYCRKSPNKRSQSQQKIDEEIEAYDRRIAEDQRIADAEFTAFRAHNLAIEAELERKGREAAAASVAPSFVKSMSSPPVASAVVVKSVPTLAPVVRQESAKSRVMNMRLGAPADEAIQGIMKARGLSASAAVSFAVMECWERIRLARRRD